MTGYIILAALAFLALFGPPISQTIARRRVK